MPFKLVTTHPSLNMDIHIESEWEETSKRAKELVLTVYVPLSGAHVDMTARLPITAQVVEDLFYEADQIPIGSTKRPNPSIGKISSGHLKRIAQQLNEMAQTLYSSTPSYQTY